MIYVSGQYSFSWKETKSMNQKAGFSFVFDTKNTTAPILLHHSSVDVLRNVASRSLSSIVQQEKLVINKGYFIKVFTYLTHAGTAYRTNQLFEKTSYGTEVLLNEHSSLLPEKAIFD